MTAQPSLTSFLQMLALSGLLSREQMTVVEERFSTVAGDRSADVSPQEIMVWLLKQKLITPWHAEKLLQGRFRGFFLGDYKLLNRIARGGMSTIYAAEDRQSGAVHALKVLPPSKTKTASYLQRFQREAATTQRLNHPNIVRVFGIFSGTDGQADVHFMAMELLEGRDLFDTVNADGPLPCRTAVDFILQAALGLEHAHQAGLVHRDIKPGNLFLSDDQTVRILDLGLAQDFDSDENLTREYDERVLGTADYLSPEQAADSHTVDNRADIYSLGCSLYFLLTGQPPFTEGTLVQRLIAHQKKTPPALSEFRSDVPEELIQILLQMMAKNRNDRTATAGEVANRLRNFLDATAHRSELDAKPIILKREETKTTANRNSAAFTPESVSSVVQPADKFLTEFSVLLKRIESDCDVDGSLSKDSRSTRLLAVAKELRQLAEGVTPTPDVLSVEDSVSLNWPTEDTVLNDIAATSLKSDPKAIAPQVEQEVASKLMINELLAAMELDNAQAANESGVPLLKTTDLPHRTINARQSKSPATGRMRYWVLAAIVAGTAVAAIVWFALK